MKKRIVNAILLIFLAILIFGCAVAGSYGLLDFAGIGAWQMILGAACLVFAVSALCKRHPEGIFFPLAILFWLFEAPIARACHAPTEQLISPWLLLLCALLLTWGVGMLRRRGKHRSGSGHVLDGGHFGNTKKYIDCRSFNGGEFFAENNMGMCSVYFTNTQEYAGGGILHVDNNMGSMVLYVPAQWQITTSVENSMGSVQQAKPQTPPAQDAPALTIVGENNLGSLQIKLV